MFEDAADEGRWLETFVVDSWLEHLRQHERVTNADRALEEAVCRFQIGGPPHVTLHRARNWHRVSRPGEFAMTRTAQLFSGDR